MQKALAIAICLVLVILSLASEPTFANKVKRLNISPIAGFSQAPEVEVYSTSGEGWTDVDKTRVTEFRVRLSAKCQFEGRGNKAYKGVIEVPGFVRVGNKEPANFLIPHADEAYADFRWDGGDGQPLSPVAACNEELEKRAANSPGKTRYHLLAEGFTIDYPAALRVAYDFRCEATGLGRTDLDGDSTLVNTRIKCLPSAKAASKIEPERPQPIRAARLVPLLKTGSFEAEPEVHTGDCPATIKFAGTLTANRPGTVRYRYTKHDGTRSPEFTLDFDRAGTRKTRPWQTTFSKPDPSGTLSLTAEGGASDDFNGWYRLDVLSPEPTGQIVARYRILCGADAQDARTTTLQAVPAERPVEVQQLQMKPLDASPTRRSPEPQPNPD